MTTYGLQLPSFSFGGPDSEIFDRTAALARAADETGFSSLWVMDHLYQLPALGGSEQPMLEAYTLLGALAAVTENVTLGTLVTGVTYRNAAFLAKAVTTLDVISHGRAVYGIGAAWHDVEHAAFGYDFPRIGVRLDMVEEAVQIARAMFTGDDVSFTGEHFSIAGMRVFPKPVRPGGPPIMIGGSGEKRTLKLVAQYADACNFTGGLAVVPHKIEVLHGHCEAVGRDPSEIKVTRLGTLMLVESEAEADERRQMVAGFAGADYAATVVVGTPDSILEQCAAYAEIGVDELIFNMPGAQPEEVRAAGELLNSARPAA